MTDITIRPLETTDIPRMVEVARDPEIQKLTLFVKAAERGEALSDVFNKLISIHPEGKFCSYAVMQGGDIVGYVNSYKTESTDVQNTYWLGSWTDAGRRQQGIARKALGLLIEQIRAQDIARNVTSLFKAAARASNTASIGLITGVGFHEDATQGDAPNASEPMKHYTLG